MIGKDEGDVVRPSGVDHPFDRLALGRDVDEERRSIDESDPGPKRLAAIGRDRFGVDDQDVGAAAQEATGLDQVAVGDGLQSAGDDQQPIAWHVRGGAKDGTEEPRRRGAVDKRDGVAETHDVE